MEISRGAWIFLWLVMSAGRSWSQEQHLPSYTIKDGRMYVSLSKHMDRAQLDSFVVQYDLQDLNLRRLILPDKNKNKFERLRKMGWRVEIDDPGRIAISKAMGGLTDMSDPGRRIAVTEEHPNNAESFPSVNDDILFGANLFTRKFPFAVRDSFVTFYLRGNDRAKEVMLAGSFTNWQNGAIPMTGTDSGWITTIKLTPGKYWYKFIINGGWTVDPDNRLQEDDGRGNTNSVYYKTNTLFLLKRFPNAGAVFLIGSFNNWNPNDLPMLKTSSGWRIDVYLSAGTHTYKFMVDGAAYTDPENTVRMPDGHNGFNSVLSIGRPHIFVLKGNLTATKVILAGSFNNWNTFELRMVKTSSGWTLPYTLGPGDYAYKFIVDNRWILDPNNPLFIHYPDKNIDNSYLIIGPNYTFRLPGFLSAGKVYLAGDFNNWTPGALPMKKVGDQWTVDIHLSVGKHLYKYIVDGQWIRDPSNPYWEQNDDNSGNSVIWMEH